jgi:hypothetical protein
MYQYKARYKTDSDTEYQRFSVEIGMYVELFGKEIGLPKPALLVNKSSSKNSKRDCLAVHDFRFAA